MVNYVTDPESARAFGVIIHGWYEGRGGNLCFFLSGIFPATAYCIGYNEL